MGLPAVASRRNGQKGGRPIGSKALLPGEVKARIMELYRSHADEIAGEMLRIAMHGEFEPTRLNAIDKIQDRIYGKPPQPHDGDGMGGGIILQVYTGVPEPDED